MTPEMAASWLVEEVHVFLLLVAKRSRSRSKRSDLELKDFQEEQWGNYSDNPTYSNRH